MVGKLDTTPGVQSAFGVHGIKEPGAFHLGDSLNYNPREEQYAKDGFLKDFVLKGWLPEKRFIEKGTKVTAFGSCFAANITRHLTELGFDLSGTRDPDIYISAIGEGLVNTHALLGQLEWALLDKKQPEGLWHGFKAEGYGYDEDIRQRTRKVLLETEFFIITLGLSEVWYDEVTGGVFWRAVPQESFDASRHKFRVSTLAETKANIARIYALIREYVPDAKVLFTLSPIPLAATFRPVNCLTANSVSKAILRSALDEMLRDNAADLNKRLFYFPSYEVVQELFPERFQSDCRHPKTWIVNFIMTLFECTHCDTDASFAQATADFQKLRQRSIERRETAPNAEDREVAIAKKRARRKAKAAKRRAGKSSSSVADEE